MKTRGAIALAALLLYFGIAAAVGWAGYEFKQAFSPNTHKAEIAKADADAAALARQAADAQAKQEMAIAANQAAIAASQADKAAQLAIEQSAAGFLAGVLVALPDSQSATLDEKIASILAKDAADTLPPATSKQVQEFTVIVAQMRANNARLSAALIAKEQEAQQAKQDAARQTQVAAEAKARAMQSDTAARDSAEATKAEAKAHADDVAKLAGKTAENLTFLRRLKAFGIGGWLIIFVIVPLVALAFPATAPAIKKLFSWLLKFWQLIHEREISAVHQLRLAAEAEAQKAQTQLQSEMAAHENTKAMLVKISTTP